MSIEPTPLLMSLPGQPAFFWIISVIASAVQVALIIGAFIGQGTSSDVGLKSWIRSTPLRFATAFFTGLGWGGVFALRKALPPDAQWVIALISGVAFMLLMVTLMRALLDR